MGFLFGVLQVFYKNCKKQSIIFLKRWNLPFTSRIEDLFEKFKILRVDEYSQLALLCLGKKYHTYYNNNNQLNNVLPEMLLNFVKPIEKERTTRSKYQFLPHIHNYTLFEASPVYRLVKCWNELPLKIKENEIFRDFKYDATQFLINKRIPCKASFIICHDFIYVCICIT